MDFNKQQRIRTNKKNPKTNNNQSTEEKIIDLSIQDGCYLSEQKCIKLLIFRAFINENLGSRQAFHSDISQSKFISQANPTQFRQFNRMENASSQLNTSNSNDKTSAKSLPSKIEPYMHFLIIFIYILSASS